jgi:hypothetical protein
LVPYTVVLSDVAKHDAGFRGTRAFWNLATYFGAYAELGLYWFLTEYFGRSRVRLYRPTELLSRSNPIKTDVLFVGLPTSLNRDHLASVRYNRMVLYDSTDEHQINFDSSDKAFLMSLTDTCLKNWRDERWNPELKVGLLPIKRPPWNNRLHMAIRMNRLKSRLFGSMKRNFDVGFVARPTGSITTNQRLRWLIELKTQRPELKLWGGLVGKTSMRAAIEQEVDASILESIWLKKRKIDFFKYYSGLLQSKVALAPCGFAPWTYRHFEAMDAGCMVVSNDLSHYEFLIPFPREGMIEIPEAGSVVDAVDRALECLESNPNAIEENRRYLDQWLVDGKYSRRCSKTMDRFMSYL